MFARMQQVAALVFGMVWSISQYEQAAIVSEESNASVHCGYMRTLLMSALVTLLAVVLHAVASIRYVVFFLQMG